jgi:hypothetical protein
MPTGAELIAAERARQINEEGHTAEHDATVHGDESLANAAAVIIGEGMIGYDRKFRMEGSMWMLDMEGSMWMLEIVDKYKDDRVRQLAIAGALIAAEIDRLQGQGEDGG